MPPTQFHERTWELLVEAIKKELDRLANNLPNLAEHRRNVVPCGSARLSASTDPVSSGWKSPDSQFQYKGVPGSTFVIEIACSQHPNDLRNKIKDYFMLLPSVCTVLAIDIDCKESVAVRQDPQYKHAAKVLLWAREKVQDNKQTIRCYKNVIFRPGGSGHVPPGELTIPFKFFLPQVKRDNTAAQDEELIFPYPSLAAWIEEAENDDRVQSTAPLPPPKRQRYDFIYEDGTVEEEVYEPKVQTRKC
ncbi:hypothetical protein F4860DRAFT_462590 [Xylaria cubensis]|nr:hypothetical protein F4860DRAFT_462590 [Xylaria cubensis]